MTTLRSDGGAAASNMPAKLAACLAVLACVGIGIVGLVLPIVPGIVFLALAAVVAARHFPSVARRLRRNETLERHLDSADRFLELPVARKAQVGALLCVKILLDALAFAGAAASRLLESAKR